MRHQAGQVGHLLFEVGVDRDPGAVVALVVVESRPGLVGDDLVDDRLCIGQRVGGANNVAQLAGERVDALLKALRWDLPGAAVGRHPLGQGPGATEHLVEAGMGGAIAIRIAPADVDVKVLPDLLDESDLLAGELAARAGQRTQVRGDEVGPLLREHRVAGQLGELGQQSVGLPGQLGRIGRGFVGDCPAQRGRTGVGVDVALLDAVEPQAQHEVFGNEVVGLHGVHANCHTVCHGEAE